MKRILSFFIVLFLPFSLLAQTTGTVPKLKTGSYLKGSDVSLIAKADVISEGIIRIAAVRVDFIEDENNRTTGNGKFDYSSDQATVVDPAPHDKSYFLDQLEALKRYYSRVSGGKLDIEYDVYPAGEQDSYSLGQQMDYYNPDTDEQELDLRLSELLRDAVVLADPDIDFSAYDAVIVFHAGVGSDFLLEDVALDPTPHDIPSVHLGLRHLCTTLGGSDPAYQGISVENGGVFITSGTILPETETKRETEIGLLGIMAHQFGHELGLPSLFNTGNGRPAIGKWGLMGVGFANFNSVIPAEPSAWSKVYMGWETPEIVTSGSNLPVHASMSNSGTKIYKIPVTPYEYFLVENRLKDFDFDGLNFIRAESGVLLEVDDYDYDIPGSGLLIWHIDEKIIAAGLQENTVNTNPRKRGVDLEEADGSQDIGELFPGLIPGLLSPENGLPQDAFYFDNNSEFTPSSVPDSYSNSMANSQISITAVSDTGKVMYFSVSRERTISEFPVFLGGDFSGMSPVFTGAAGFADSAKLVIANNEGELFALNGYNAPLLNNNSEKLRSDAFGNQESIEIPLFAASGSGIITQPVYGSFDFPSAGFRNRLIAVTEDNSILYYSLSDRDSDLSGDLIYETEFTGTVSAPPVLGSSLVLGFQDGSVKFYNSDGSFNSDFSPSSGEVSGFAGNLGQNDILELFTVYDSGYISHYVSGEQPVEFSPFSGEIPLLPILSKPSISEDEALILLDMNAGFQVLDYYDYSQVPGLNFDLDPVAGDINGDGRREIITGAGSEIYALEINGTLVTGFPVDIGDIGYTDNISTNFILADLNGDGSQDILFGTDEGNLFAINSAGIVLPGFPLPAGSGLTGTPTIYKNPVNGRIELSALDEDGYLYLWDLGTYSGDNVIAWSTYGGSGSHLRHSEETLAAPQEPPSNILMPSESVYNWPNPNRGNWTNIRYYLHYDADVTIKVYNQVGDKIVQLNGSGYAGIDNEITWDLGNVQSGVYFAQVTASGNGMTESKVIKIAVIK